MKEKKKVPCSKTDDLVRFYTALEHLESGVGGKRGLSRCDGKMDWPERGVCFFFENGESRSGSGDGPRIVYVGTHALTRSSKRTLWNRLSQHRGSVKTGGGNHRGSILRLLIGEALMEQDPGCRINTWGKGSSTPPDVRAAEFELERMVSRVVGEMPFLWLEVDDSPGSESLRGYIKRNAIALLSNYHGTPVDQASDNWLGCCSPREKVQHSGLWNQRHVEDNYDPEFLSELESFVSKQIKATERKAGTRRRRPDIIVVISCAGRKSASAGHMLTENGQRVMFVADPEKAPPDGSIVHKRPDDAALPGLSWRDVLCKYNSKYKDAASGNPLGLLPAWQLYKNPVYGELVCAFGLQNVFILSAGWGFIPSDFLTPNYDITFSAQADTYKRRRIHDRYEDFVMLPKDTRKPVVFLGGKDYIPSFCSLTKGIKSKRTVFYNSKTPPKADGCGLLRFKTNTKTNWHYECAKEILEGNIVLAESSDAESGKTPMARKREISEALIGFGEKIKSLPSSFRMPEKISTVHGANHFFVGVMFDYQIDTARAWEAGYRIEEKYGGVGRDFWKIIKKTKSEKLYEFIRHGNGGKAWHQYPRKMTERLWRASEIMLREYDGDPGKIWRREKDVGKVKRRFKEFDGIGTQLSRMAVMILVRDYGEVGGEKSLPSLYPKEDVHTKRVFQRAGLTNGKTTVVSAAREMNPDFPAILDLPVWTIGMKYCFKNNPDCKQCPIDKVCPKNIESDFPV